MHARPSRCAPSLPSSQTRHSAMSPTNNSYADYYYLKVQPRSHQWQPGASALRDGAWHVFQWRPSMQIVEEVFQSP